jgi:hypothetical protein
VLHSDAEEVTAPVPAADPARPEPKCGQIWSAASPEYGRRFVRVESVRLKGKEDNYVNVTECGRGGGSLRLPKPSYRGLSFYIVTPGGTMPSYYQFEKEASS